MRTDCCTTPRRCAVEQFSERSWPLLRAREIRPMIGHTFPGERAQQAHEYVADNKNVDKVILLVGDQEENEP